MHVEVWQKTKFCRSTTLQLKNKYTYYLKWVKGIGTSEK